MSKIMELADAYAEKLYLRQERHETRAALAAEVEKLERDAARYRWLKEANSTQIISIFIQRDIDAAIDAALGEKHD